MSAVVKTIGLTRDYNGIRVVDNVELQVKEGRIYGFLGPNGAGKSTTLKMLLGLIKQSGGEIEVFGRQMNLKNRIDILSDVGSLIESPSYYGHLSGYENLKVSACLTGAPPANIEKVLEIVRLENHARKKAANYSLGMKQRLGIASALLTFPKLLILDEPTNGLDPAGIGEMRELIRALPKAYGMTVVVSSHLLSEIDQIADDVGIISNGKLVFQDSLNALHNLDNTKSLEEIFLDLTGREVSL